MRGEPSGLAIADLISRLAIADLIRSAPLEAR
jgi:hypothetical protein